MMSAARHPKPPPPPPRLAGFDPSAPEAAETLPFRATRIMYPVRTTASPTLTDSRWCSDRGRWYAERRDEGLTRIKTAAGYFSPQNAS